MKNELAGLLGLAPALGGQATSRRKTLNSIASDLLDEVKQKEQIRLSNMTTRKEEEKAERDKPLSKKKRRQARRRFAFEKATEHEEEFRRSKARAMKCEPFLQTGLSFTVFDTIMMAEETERRNKLGIVNSDVWKSLMPSRHVGRRSRTARVASKEDPPLPEPKKTFGKKDSAKKRVEVDQPKRSPKEGSPKEGADGMPSMVKEKRPIDDRQEEEDRPKKKAKDDHPQAPEKRAMQDEQGAQDRPKKKAKDDAGADQEPPKIR